MNLRSVLLRAQELADSAPEEAIRLLEDARPVAGFYPHGAWTLAGLLGRAGKLAEQLLLLADTFQEAPTHFRLWDSLLQHERLDACSKARVSSAMIDVLVEEEGFPLWLRPLIPDLLVFADKEDIAPYFRLLSKSLGESISSDTLDGLINIRRVLLQVRELLEENNGTTFTCWRLIVDSTDARACAVQSERLEINLSTLRVSAITDWVDLFTKPLARGLLAMLSASAYSDDMTVCSWSSSRVEDALTCHYLVLLRSFVLPKSQAVIRSRPDAAKLRRGCLLVRVGNVELNALWTHLTERSALRDPARAAMEALARASPTETQMLGSKPWWPRQDAVGNIIQLATNAGFYAAPQNAAGVFDRWAAEYLEAMEEGELLLYVPELIAKFAALRPALRAKRPQVLDQAEMLSVLSRSRSVVVSAYAREISDQFSSGRLFSLWTEMGFAPDEANVLPVTAPMSVWPYQPHRSWEETFDLLCQEVSHAILESHASVLVASCGCYGLPLCRHMNALLGVTAVYEGHVANAYFGVVTKATRQSWLFQRFGSSAHWRESDLATRVPEIVLIDKGRYT